MNRKAASFSARRGRRGARRLLVQALYRWLVAGGEAAPLAVDFLAEPSAAEIDRDYFRELFPRAIEEAEALDALLAPCLDRAPGELDPVEHAILLLAAAELRERRELGVSIIVNEAVELARTFGAEGGHRYVNGVLDCVAGGLRPGEKAARANSGG